MRSLNPLSGKYYVAQYCIRGGSYFEPVHLFKTELILTPVCGKQLAMNLVWNWGVNGISLDNIQCPECLKIARELLEKQNAGA